MPRVLGFAMVTFVLASMVLPLAMPSGVSAADDDNKPKIKLNGNANLLEPEGKPEQSLVLPNNVDLIDDDGGDQGIEIPADVDLGIGEEGGDDQPILDVPGSIEFLPELPIIDLPNCVDGDGDGESFPLPWDVQLVDNGQTLQLPGGLSPNDFWDSPHVGNLFDGLFGQGVELHIPDGVYVDFDLGMVFIPECEDQQDKPILRIPPGFILDVNSGEDDGQPPVIDFPTCVDNEDGWVLNIPPDLIVEMDPDAGDIYLAPGFDLDLGDFQPGADLPPNFDFGFGNGVVLRIPSGLLDLDGDDPIVYVPACENEVEPGYVTVHKYGCMATIPFDDPDLDALRESCGALSNVTFSLHNSNGDVEFEESQVTDVDGLAMWFVDQPGQVTISETIPDGYTDSIVVFCGIIQGTGQFPQSLALVDATGGVVYHDLAAGQQLYCDWFNKAEYIDIEVPLGGSAVVIYKHNCIPGFDVYNADADGVAAACSEEQDGVTFHVEELGAATTSGVSGTDGPGKVVFTGLDSGEYVVVEEIPAGYGEPVVYCALGESIDEYPDVEFARMDFYAPGAVFSVLTGNDVLYCHFFNVPSDDATVVIYKHACIDGFDAYNADQDGLAANCSEMLDDVSFTVEELGAASVSGATGSNGPGKAVFTGLDSGEYIVTEDVPQGYGEPIVYCAIAGAGAGEPADYAAMDFYAENTIFSVLTNDDVLYCHWFNVPTAFENAEEDGTVILDKYECPAAPIGDLDLAQWLADNCAPMNDVDFVLSFGIDTILSATTGQDGDGRIIWSDLPAIKVAIEEVIPAGYGEPVVYCAGQLPGEDQPGAATLMQLSTVANYAAIRYELDEGETLYCSWINLPYDEDGEVVIYKFDCPYLPDLSGFGFQGVPEGCERMPGVEFTLSYGIDTILPAVTSDPEGTVAWGDLPAVTVSISEQLPDGYGDPVVICLSVYQTENGPVESVYDPTMTGSSFAYDLKGGETLYCFWLNIPYDDGSITIVKYVCAPGYDLYAQGANPEWDCQDEANGVAFTLNGPSNDGATADTGSSGSGTLTWGNLAAGDYTVTEQVPNGTDYVFVLSCESERAKWIQGYPLVFGSQIDIPLLSGDHVICSFYNVPEEPDYGTITVIKYVCPTATFQDADDCERYEDGVSFHLSFWTGNGWVEATQGTTNSNGVLTWYGLEPGTYEIDEVGGTWCYASADRIDSEGNLVVHAGEETTVWVYNCGQKVVTKKPQKFPNTGAGQTAGATTGAHAPVAPALSETLLDPTQWMGVLDGRLIEPFLSPGKPVSIEIEKIGVDARIETLEVIDGAIQDPTTADKVAWYKDTAKLDEETGNVVMAGHLNYWGVPEGVFFRLNGLEKGDEIVVTAQDGTVYRYRVDWVKQIDAFDGDVAKLVGKTKKPSLTLITCGGQWNDAAQEYDHRTVVRATLVVDEA